MTNRIINLYEQSLRDRAKGLLSKAKDKEDESKDALIMQYLAALREISGIILKKEQLHFKGLKSKQVLNKSKYDPFHIEDRDFGDLNNILKQLIKLLK